jgi:hypothetical protein
MPKADLGPALCDEVYLKIGEFNEELLKQVMLDSPRPEGAAIGIAVLRALGVKVPPNALHDPTEFFREWIADHDGKNLPGHSRTTISRVVSWCTKDNNESMKSEDNLRWVGLAVLVAVSYGIWRLLKNARVAPEGQNVPTPPLPPRAKKTRICVAMGIFAGQLPPEEFVASSAADLVSKATFWWVGDTDSWPNVGKSGIFIPLIGSPSSDDALIMLVMNLIHTSESPPTSRPEVSSLLRAAGTRDIELVNKFTVSKPGELMALGFKR